MLHSYFSEILQWYCCKSNGGRGWGRAKERSGVTASQLGGQRSPTKCITQIFLCENVIIITGGRGGKAGGVLHCIPLHIIVLLLPKSIQCQTMLCDHVLWSRFVITRHCIPLHIIVLLLHDWEQLWRIAFDCSCFAQVNTIKRNCIWLYAIGQNQYN